MDLGVEKVGAGIREDGVCGLGGLARRGWGVEAFAGVEGWLRSGEALSGAGSLLEAVIELSWA